MLYQQMRQTVLPELDWWLLKGFCKTQRVWMSLSEHSCSLFSSNGWWIHCHWRRRSFSAQRVKKSPRFVNWFSHRKHQIFEASMSHLWASRFLKNIFKADAWWHGGVPKISFLELKEVVKVLLPHFFRSFLCAPTFQNPLLSSLDPT